MKFIFSEIIFFFLVIKVYGFDKIDIIIERHKEFLLKTIPTGKDKAEIIIQLFNDKTGEFSDINYNDNNPAQWQIAEHLEHTKDLALYWNSLSKSEEKKYVFFVIRSALRNWYYYKYESSNWWYNEIGIPRLMRDILVLIKDSLNSNLFDDYLEIVNQYKIKSPGTNLTWSADLALFYGVFTKKTSLIEDAVEKILKEIKIGNGEGLQPDYSFLQHGARLQLYHYGRGFLIENLRLAWELMETEWSFPKEKLMILHSMLSESWRWIARGLNTVPETMDRAGSRMDALKCPDIRAYMPFFLEILPEFEKEFNDVLSDQNNNQSSLTGFKGFPYSDFAAYHNKKYSCFVKTISTRTLPSESINNENLKGKLLNSGELYFIKNGTEYFNLTPVWNWKMLPGITAFDNAEEMQRDEYSGFVSDGKIGMVSMNFKMLGKRNTEYLSCKKTWFLLKGLVVCLMSDFQLNEINSAYTVMDQCRLKNKISTANGKLENGRYNNIGEDWVEHNGFVYMPIYKKDKLNLFAGRVSGDWYDINHSYTKGVITDSIFMPSLYHVPDTQRSGYAVLFSSTPKKISRFIKDRPFKIIRNDGDCQALKVSNNLILASFYKSASLKLGFKIFVVSDKCLAILSKNKLYLSDPGHKGKTIEVIYDNKKYSVKLPKDGGSIEVII